MKAQVDQIRRERKAQPATGHQGSGIPLEIGLIEQGMEYRRHIELEVRLLEKEWSGEPGLFATTRIR